VRGIAPLALPAALLAAGCGATTVRVAAGPTLDTGRHVGAVSTLSLGLGLPVDFHGRSHHYVQGLASVGGGRDGATGAGMAVVSADLDYVRWVEPTLDARAGFHFAYQNLPGNGTSRYGGGAHAALLPMVYQDDTTWIVTHLCVGPELRAEVLSGNPAGGALGVFSLPLVIELNLLGAGD
jgi:hypothetical protein